MDNGGYREGPNENAAAKETRSARSEADKRASMEQAQKVNPRVRVAESSGQLGGLDGATWDNHNTD